MRHINAPIAQLVEHRTLNPQVVGSIPTGGTVIKILLINNDEKCFLLYFYIIRHTMYFIPAILIV